VEARLVGAGAERMADVVDDANPAADRQGNEHLAGRRLDGSQHQRPAFVTGRDVEEGDLVGAFGVIAGGDFDRIAGVPEVEELDALDDATVVDVEAGDDPAGDAHEAPAKVVNAVATSKAPS